MAGGSIVLPSPPVPNTTDQKTYNQQLYNWAVNVKGLIESNSRSNSQPSLQGVALGTYVLSTEIDNTLTGTALANAVCTLLQALQTAGIITPSTRT